MSIAYLVTIAPQIIGSIVLEAALPKTKEAHDILNISKSAFHLIYIASSVINPLLTMVGKLDYKKSFMRMIPCNKETKGYTSH